ncbi:MAG: hypothetical protein WBQ46_02740 [Terriglobales bacterium]
MAAVLLLLVMMASTPTTMTVTPNSANATSTATSSGDAIRAAQTWHNWIFAAYVLLLAITVLGTFLVWWSGNRAQNAIQVAANARIEEVKADSRENIARVENDAKERIAQAKRESDEKIAGLKTEAEQAKAGIAEANKAAEIAKKEAAEANKTAEQERIERLKLEAQIAPRRLTIAQQREIAGACRRFSGRSVSVVTYSLDAEGAVLGKQIIAALQAGGMKVGDQTASLMPLGGFSLGVHVSGSEQDLVIGLSEILKSLGHLVVAPPGSQPQQAPSISTGPAPGAGSATVLVGIKPVQ